MIAGFPHFLRHYCVTCSIVYLDSIEQLVAEDNLVAAQFTFRGTHEGSIPDFDIEPTGAEIELAGMEFDRIEDGKLVEPRLLYDTLDFMQQLGAIPAEEIPGEQ